MALVATPTTSSFAIAKELTPRRMSEYGANQAFYQSLLDEVPDFSELNYAEVLQKQLEKLMDFLDLT
ncbi:MULTISPECIES: hypothetical protein [Peribacillus]|uniref:hypothetical protein n=1 Tax=Peribacillus TaxID=2675229 RepID=UPI0020406630|nr:MULTISPECIES: hypothetical protein [Peribacillus]MCM3675231.1 hypothetical protein [Peribacillus simplex]MDQ0879170.1 hypothetical protein [Peribacillus sp. V2I11]